MVKTLSAGMLTHIAQRATALCTCWKITRTDGVVQGFTDFQSDITFSSVTYKAGTGYDATAITGNVNLAVDNQEVKGLIDHVDVSDVDLRNGIYDFAGIEVFLLNYENTSLGKITLRRGVLGEVIITEGEYTAEVRGLANFLTTNYAEVYSKDCATDLGSARCKINLAPLVVTATIRTVIVSQWRLDCSVFSYLPVSDYYSGGLLTFTSGACNGKAIEIKAQTTTPFITGGILGIDLYLPSPGIFAVGDTFSMTPGCDKSWQTCVNKYNNILNFRGFPFIPGQDQILKTPNAS